MDDLSSHSGHLNRSSIRISAGSFLISRIATKYILYAFALTTSLSGMKTSFPSTFA